MFHRASPLLAVAAELAVYAPSSRTCMHSMRRAVGPSFPHFQSLFASPSRSVSSSIFASRLAQVEARHRELTDLMMNAGNGENQGRAKLGRELAALERTAAAIVAYRACAAEAADLEAVLQEAVEGGRNSSSSGGSSSSSPSSELAKMANEELEALRPALDAHVEKLTRLLIPRDEADDRSAILEVRMGVGGEEAALFAGELLKLYENFCLARGWSWRPMSIQLEDAYGGVREASIAVEGAAGGGGGGGDGGDGGGGSGGVFGVLKFESGVHRVQRVPITQSTGKLQTSTATVAVLPEAEEVDIDIKPSDLRVDTYRAGGAGGQHVNTTDSAVRITHLPTGTVVAIQDERSQIQNRAKAMRVLRARLFEAERERLATTRSEARMAQIGSSARSERVRTYNFMQNRVTDHRIGESFHDMQGFMEGRGLEGFITALQEQAQEQALKEMEEQGQRQEKEREKERERGKEGAARRA